MGGKFLPLRVGIANLKEMPTPPPRRVLVCPLDWGLGHATRCVPVIREFLAQGADVVLGTTGLQVAFFQAEFPGLLQIPCPSYQIRYPSCGWMMPFWLGKEAPRLFRLISQEQEWAEQACHTHGIHLLLSDNRFGCYSRHIPSIYITHQVRIPFATPFQHFEFLGEWLHARLQKPFREVWIPDCEGPQNLGTRMSHSGIISGKHRFVGPLTRFVPSAERPEKQYECLVLLSGPEPQRSVLEAKILSVLSGIPGRKILVQGRPGCEPSSHSMPDLEIHSHLESSKLQQAILASKWVLCRSGYSSLMDLQALGAKAVLIPTPGQTEQELLAHDLRKKRVCGALNQADITLEAIRHEAATALGFTPPPQPHSRLQDAVANALRSLP